MIIIFLKKLVLINHLIFFIIIRKYINQILSIFHVIVNTNKNCEIHHAQIVYLTPSLTHMVVVYSLDVWLTPVMYVKCNQDILFFTLIIQTLSA